MRKRGIVGKVLGIAAVFAMIGVVFLGSPGIVDSVADPDAVDTVGVAAQAQSNCGCSPLGSIGFQNPAAEYCAKMGYEYKTVKTEAGERGICVLPNGDEVDAWAFYRGECAPQFSYCAKMGWPVAAEGQGDSYSDKCTTCSLPDGSQKTVSELLDLGPDGTVAVDTLIDKGSYEATPTVMVGGLPESFDWRDKDGQNWMTPVRDQGVCGSCWAFGIVGAVEPQYSIFANDSNIDLDLSEQYLVSCSGAGGCGGGNPYSALAFVQDEGIIDEACFPYTAKDSPCGDKCTDWSHRLYTIDDIGWVPENITAIREYLIEKGPLSATIGIGPAAGGSFDGDIYRCTNDYVLNHEVVIVGYDEAQDCWIAKNSWGTEWGDDGYFKVGCSECGIESNVLYATLDHSENVIYQSDEIDDSAGGDGDGNAEPGESIATLVTLWNRSANTTFTDVRGNLTASTRIDSGSTIFSEDFEGSWPGNWTVGDWNNYSGEDYWGQSDYRAYSGNFSAYCANVSDVAGQYYDNDMNAFMVRDVDISAYDLATLSYKYWLESETYYDRLYAGYFDGSWYWVDSYTGDSSGWVSDTIEVPATATQVGFRFYSDYSITREGAYVDDVVLTGHTYTYGPDPYINITDDSEEYGAISAGDMATSLDAYDFAIDPACPGGHVVIFTLNITASNGGPWTDSFERAIVIPPQVSNVDATQRSDGSGIVDISYDVSGYGTLDVSVEYWDPSSGWNFCTYTAGDVGSGITAGTGKAATWRAKTQLRRGYIPGCKVSVTATGGDGGYGSADSNTFLLDLAPPIITAKEPGGFSVSTDSSIIITFSKPMDSSSTESAFFISPAVNGSFHWTGNSMTFDPTAGLAGDTIYTVAVYGDAMDSIGNAFDGNENGISEGSPADNYIWMFTTKAAGGCFIATAAYGTPMAEEIQVLREFRDEYLLTNPAGQALVNFYYKVSPPIAEFITEHPGLKPIVRAGLAPAIAMSTMAVNTTTGQKVAIIGLVALVSVALVLWARRRRCRGPEYD